MTNDHYSHIHGVLGIQRIWDAQKDVLFGSNPHGVYITEPDLIRLWG